MVQVNLALKEINCKIVYFGPGLSGKTTNLEVVHQKAPTDAKGELTSIATESDRTLFFDFMPLDLGTVGGMKTKFQLYTVPGQVYYNSTRKLVLRGADGVAFIADSGADKMEENIESLENLEECLQEQGRTLSDYPHVIQFNKRDLPDVVPVEEMERILNRFKVPTNTAVASRGEGVIETFKNLSGLVLDKVKAMAAQRTTAPRPMTAARPTTGQSKRPTEVGESGRPDQLRGIQRNAPPMPDRDAVGASAAGGPPTSSRGGGGTGKVSQQKVPPPKTKQTGRQQAAARTTTGKTTGKTTGTTTGRALRKDQTHSATRTRTATRTRPSTRTPARSAPSSGTSRGRTVSGSLRAPRVRSVVVASSSGRSRSRGPNPLIWVLVGAAVAGAFAYALHVGLI